MKKESIKKQENTKYIKYEETQLYRDSREVMRYAIIEVSRMSKQYKYFLGTELINSILNIVINIAKTYEENIDMKLKYNHIKELKTSLYKSIIILRTAYDINAYNRTVYLNTIEKLINMYEQINKWENSILNKIES